MSAAQVIVPAVGAIVVFMLIFGFCAVKIYAVYKRNRDERPPVSDNEIPTWAFERRLSSVYEHRLPVSAFSIACVPQPIPHAVTLK